MSNDKQGKALIFQMSADARLLYQHIKVSAVGAVVRYDTLSQIVGREVSGSFAPLQTALLRARRDDGMEFDPVVGVGYKRLSDEEIVTSADRAMDRQRRAARRLTERLSRVRDFSALPLALQHKHNAATSIGSVIAAMTGHAAVRKVEKAVATARRELPMADTLKALGLVA